jgi:hypothetical protein
LEATDHYTAGNLIALAAITIGAPTNPQARQAQRSGPERAPNDAIPMGAVIFDAEVVS